MRWSIAMATWNGEAWLQAQLESLAGQSLRPDELVVCDDASTDSTPQILTRFAAHAPFHVEIRFHQTNLGPAKAFSTALELTRGEQIALCDQDDQWEAEKLAELDQSLQGPMPALAVCDAWLADADLKSTHQRLWDVLGPREGMVEWMGRRDRIIKLFQTNVLTGATMAFNRALLERACPIPPYWLHDAWIGLIAAACGRITAVDRPLMLYRQHEHQQIGARRNGWLRQIKTAWRMDKEWFANEVMAWTAAEQRLPGLPGADGSIRELAADKVVHCMQRLRARSGLLRRPGVVIGESLHGRYRRFSMGWRSALQDLFL